MLFILWAGLSVFSFGMFITGHLLGFHGVASIGAVMFLITGGQVALEGIEVKDGETINRTHISDPNDRLTIDNSTVNVQYEPHSWTGIFGTDNAVGTGVLQMLIGVLLFYQQMLSIGEGE